MAKCSLSVLTQNKAERPVSWVLDTATWRVTFMYNGGFIKEVFSVFLIWGKFLARRISIMFPTRNYNDNYMFSSHKVDTKATLFTVVGHILTAS